VLGHFSENIRMALDPIPAAGDDLKFTALVLAASRRGADDPVAQIQRLRHKCLVMLNGVAMVQRVVETLRATPCIGRIFVSIEGAEILRTVPALRELLDQGKIHVVLSEDNLADSVRAAALRITEPHPLIVTTADNALHTPEILDHFCRQVRKGTADTYVAMTPAETILRTYPEGQRAFHRLKDGSYSSCNLYCLANARAVSAVRAFATGGQFGKKPWRVIAMFGLFSFLLYKLRLLTLAGLMQRASKIMEAKIEPVLVPFPEAPIDVDNAKDYALVTEILRARESPDPIRSNLQSPILGAPGRT